jgi:hypothetical protein
VNGAIRAPESALEQPKRHLEPRDALPVRAGDRDGPAQYPSKPPVAAYQRIAVAIFEK